MDSVFTLLDTQFSDKATELRVLKKHICGLPMLKENYDFEHQTIILKRILKYLTIFNRIFSPGKDLDIPELEGSMISWIPKSQTQITLRKFKQKMLDKQALDGTCLSVTYHTILTEELNTITNLHANEETKKHMLGATGLQTLNIVETPVDTTKNQFDDQSEYPVHYGSNNYSPAHNKTKPRPQPPNPSKITILKRDQSGNDTKTQNFNLPCML